MASSLASKALTEHSPGVSLLHHIPDWHPGGDKPINITLTAKVNGGSLGRYLQYVRYHHIFYCWKFIFSALGRNWGVSITFVNNLKLPKLSGLYLLSVETNDHTPLSSPRWTPLVIHPIMVFYTTFSRSLLRLNLWAAQHRSRTRAYSQFPYTLLPIQAKHLHSCFWGRRPIAQ